jgi:hypothetical protein
MASGTSDPAICLVGQEFLNTSAALKMCNTANQWALVVNPNGGTPTPTPAHITLKRQRVGVLLERRLFGLERIPTSGGMSVWLVKLSANTRCNTTRRTIAEWSEG